MFSEEPLLTNIIGTTLVIDIVIMFFYAVQCYLIVPFSFKYVEKWTAPDIAIAPAFTFPYPAKGIVPVILAMTMVWGSKALRKKLGNRYEEYLNSFPRFWFYYLSILGYVMLFALCTFLITLIISVLIKP